MLSKRLLSLTKYIDKNDHIIDIGCDHALLDIYLIKEHIVDYLIVSDIHSGALDAGIKNIKEAHFEKRIEARLGNGLEVIKDDDVIDTIIISGMGTKTITDILDHPYLEHIAKLIIQSNNDHTILREYLTKKGFYIAAEEFLEDHDKHYINIIFKKGSQSYSKRELRYGPILIKNKEYLNFELNNCLKIQRLIPKMKLKYQLSLKREINLLKKLIKNIN